VCGVLTDVFVARQRNARSKVYDFVRFSHVKNANKLSKALNNAWFGHFRVWDREARFDRFANNGKKPLVVSKSSRHKEEVSVKEKEVGRALGEREKNVRMGEGVEPIVGNGRSGEGEKNVRVGRVDVKVNGVVRNTKGRRREMEMGDSPVLKLSEEWRLKERKKVDTIFLNVDDEGRTHRVTEDEMDNFDVPTKLVAHNIPGVREYKFDPIDRD